MDKTSSDSSEKRKWQLAFRRYVMEGTPSEAYAPYFGLDKINLRKWFELQFSEGISWESFADNWQFDHIVPVAYFNFNLEEDLLLCWNFVNIRVETINSNKNRGNKVDVLAVKKYFSDLYDRTAYWACKKLLDKIETIEINNIEANENLISFLTENKIWLSELGNLNKEEFAKFNSGTPIKDILLEREILKKFG